MRRSFVLGAVAVVAAEVVVAALVIASGVVDVAATGGGGLQDRILGYASTRSIAHHARDEPNPLAHDPAALKRGLAHYRELCVDCHGGPGVDPAEFAAGLHPAAPDLAGHQVQSFTDGMLYRAISHGIGSTGMPAFGPTHRPDDLWSIVAFVRHLPALTPEEKAQLRSGAGEHEPEGGAPGAQAPPPAREEPRPAGPGQHVHRITISNFQFSPATLEVNVGDVVEWKNTDFAAHTATAEDGSFDTGRIDADGSKRIVASKRGRLPYFCRYHLAMKGTLVVR